MSLKPIKIVFQNGPLLSRVCKDLEKESNEAIVDIVNLIKKNTKYAGVADFICILSTKDPVSSLMKLGFALFTPRYKRQQTFLIFLYTKLREELMNQIKSNLPEAPIFIKRRRKAYLTGDKISASMKYRHRKKRKKIPKEPDVTKLMELFLKKHQV